MSSTSPVVPSLQNAPTIGVVVVSHQSVGDLGSCLDALCGARGVAQVVVVDNASADRSAALVEAVDDPRVLLVRQGANLGFAGGCNRGLELLDGALPWVAFMNPDVQVTEDCLARCAALLAEHGQMAGVAPLLLRGDGCTVDSAGQLLSPRVLEVRDRGYGRPLSDELRRPRSVLAACGALAVYRRQALQAVADGDGPWAQHFFCFWEDLELGWRLFNRGWSMAFLPAATAIHGRGAGARAGRGPLRWRRPARLEACILSNRWMTLIRHLHCRDFWVRLPRLLAWDLTLTVVGVVRRPALGWWLVCRLPLVWRELCNRGRWPRRRLADLPW